MSVQEDGGPVGLGDDLADRIPALLRYARAITDPVTADDLVQTTLLKALEHGHTFRGDAALGTWLHRILHHAFVDHLRRQREVPGGDLWDAVESRWRESDYTVDAAVVALRAGEAGALRDSLTRLPVRYRSAVVLHDMEGLTGAEVAEVQGVSLAAAKQRIRRGRMMLVDALAGADARRRATKGVPMDCWDARALVSDYLDDQLDRDAARALETHLEGCPTCPPLYSALVASRGAVSHLRDADAVIPDEVADRLRDLVSGNDASA